MTYDYLTINYAAGAGILFLLIFLHANASLDREIKQIFYLMIFIEIIEMLTYSLELWTTTFAQLSPLRLWLSAVGYAIRPVILFLILMLALRHTSLKSIPMRFILPMTLNFVAAFSVFFTDIVYSYTPDNQFIRGPLGFFTHIVALIYLVMLVIVVMRNHRGRSKLETLIIFAISLLIIFYMVLEAAFGIRTLGRTSIVMITIFYYMFFQTQIYKTSLSEEQSIRQQLEHANRIDEITGLLNKKAFIGAAEKILHPHHFLHASAPASVVFIFLDLDHLKEVNDTLGHSMGDQVIVDAAAAIQNTFRKDDLIGRFGGDEYCVLLTNTPRHILETRLEEIRTGVHKTYTNRGLSVSVTISIGAVYAENTGNLSHERLSQLADEALYEAKSSGKDRYIIKEV